MPVETQSPQTQTPQNLTAKMTCKPAVTEANPDPETLVGALYQEPNYRDRFQVTVASGHYTTVDQVAYDWFTKQPAWIRLLSTNSRSTGGVEEAHSPGGFNIGGGVGSWRLLARNDEELVFGDNMGFMEYRFSFRLIPDGNDGGDVVEGSTAVQYLWPRAGRFYFAVVKPFHRLFINRLLRITVA